MGRAVYIGDLEPDTGDRLSFDEADERALTAAVKLGGEAEVQAAVEQIVGRLRQTGQPMAQSSLFFLELLTCLMKLARGADLPLEEVFGADFTGAVRAADFASAEELGAWCLEVCLRMQSQIRRQRTDTAGKTVEMAKEYIHSHYGESDLSVEKICEYLHLSAAYFSTLFKREAGMSFIADSTEVRMDAARKRLRGTEENTYLIALSAAATMTPTTSAMCSSASSASRPPSTAPGRRGVNLRGEVGGGAAGLAQIGCDGGRHRTSRSSIQMILSLSFTAVAVVDGLFLHGHLTPFLRFPRHHQRPAGGKQPTASCS
ncbi:MAG: AraC family transcriptional regulator [Dysosmobacter sp.]